MGKQPRLSDFADPEFDPFLSDELMYGTCADVHTPLAELRRKSPVAEVGYFDVIQSGYGSHALPGQREFLVLGHAECMEVLGDPETFSNKAYENTLGLTFGDTLSVMDPPRLGGIRRLFQAAFLPRTIAQWGTEIVDPAIAGLMDAFVDRGHADLVQEFTQYYPFHVIYGQLKLPADQRRTFHRLAAAQTLMSQELMPFAKEASDKLGQYFEDMVALRRAEPSDDLVTSLVHAEVDGERLPDAVIISFLRQLINAAGDTTYRGTSTLFTALLMHPEQLDAVREDRSLVPQAIEEALRWESPSMHQGRWATRDVVLGGVEIPAGARLEIFLAVANRDETVFPDPERFDIFRAKQRNIAFGNGPHICVGQHLARLEMTRALNAVLDRLPNLRLDPDKPAPIIRGCNLRYPKHLHVLFG